MRLVILESPYAAGRGYSTDDNVNYARDCVRDCVLRGDSPIASHLLFTQPGIFLDHVPKERALGIQAGLAWLSVAECSIFYVDHKWSQGMLAALDLCVKEGREFEFRKLGKKWYLPICHNDGVEVSLRSKCKE